MYFHKLEIIINYNYILIQHLIKKKEMKLNIKCLYKIKWMILKSKIILNILEPIVLKMIVLKLCLLL